MRVAALLLFPLLLSADGPAGCFLSGRVVNAATGDPVRGARLVLERTDRRGPGGPPASYTTTTDDRGAFAMKDIEPGKYRFTARRPGFAGAEYGARRPGRDGVTLSLDAGQRLDGLLFRITPHAVISGRIVDQDGDPMDRVMVTASRYSYTNGKKQLVPADTAMTDDLGEYRLFGLPPGRYYVSATYGRAFGHLAMAAVNLGKAPEEGYVPTYYPGVIDAANASALDLSAGTQLRSVDFAISKTRTLRVRGVVNAPEGVNRTLVMVVLVPRGRFAWEMARRGVPDAQGNFELSDVRPGLYYLNAFVGDGKTTWFGRQPVEVASGNLEGIVLNLSAGFDVAGQLRFEGPPPPDLTRIEVSLDPREAGEVRFGPMPSVNPEEDGTFTLSNVGIEVYRVRLGGLPDGYYLKSVRAGDDELKEAGIDMTRGAAGPLVVTVSARAGQVEGVVLDSRGQGFAGASVVLVPEPKLRGRAEAFQQVASDQYGRFLLRTIEPGEYKLFAWEDLERGEYIDPDFLKPVEERGHPISIREGSRESVELKLISAGQPLPAKPRKIPAN